MNTLLTHRDKKKLFSYLPDVWFLAILLLGWGGLMSTMLFGAWHTVGIVLGVFLLSVTGILVKQLIRRNGAISVFMGILFLMCSLFFSLSLFSELREFSSITEEGLGFTGTGEGISSQAICSLMPITAYIDEDIAVTRRSCEGCGGCQRK